MELKVDSNKIKHIIANALIFKKNGSFNKEKYFSYLSSINLNNDEYIDIIKKKISTENLIHTIGSTDFLLENEKKRIIKLLSQKRIIKKAIFKINSIIKKQNVTDHEAQNYFYKNKNRFYIPEKFKINFIQFKINDFKTNCNDQEIKKWYVKNIQKYSTKEKRKYSIIQTKNKSDAILILLQLKKKPEDFSKLAKEKSIDPISSKKGGDIGWMLINEIPNEIKSAHLDEKNQISNIIRFQNQFLIVKLNKVLKSEKKNINEVYNTIKKEIKNKKSLHVYHQLQKKISKIIKEQPNRFDLILKESKLISQETGWFDINSIPQVLNIPILKKEIFNKQSIKKISKTQKYTNFITLKNNESFVINIKDFQNRKKPIFKNVKDKVVKDLKVKKGIEETKKKCQEIISELQKGNRNLFVKSKLFFNNLEVISRYDENPITPIIFSLPHPKKEKKIYTLYQNKNKNFEIIVLEEIFNQDFSQEEKNIIIEYLEKNNLEIIFSTLLKNLRDKAIIKYENIKLF